MNEQSAADAARGRKEIWQAIRAHEDVCHGRHVELVSRLTALETRQRHMFGIFTTALTAIIVLIIKGLLTA